MWVMSVVIHKIIGPLASAVTLGDFLDFFLLLQGEARLDVSLLNIDNLVSECLRDALHGLVSLVSGTVADQVDGLVDPSHRRHVNSLLSDHTSRTDTGAVFTGTSHKHRTHEHFKGISASEQVDDFEGLTDDPHSLNFFTGVAA